MTTRDKSSGSESCDPSLAVPAGSPPDVWHRAEALWGDRWSMECQPQPHYSMICSRGTKCCPIPHQFIEFTVELLNAVPAGSPLSTTVVAPDNGYRYGGTLAAGSPLSLVQTLRQFVGFLSADVPELHHVEVPRLAESVDRFLASGSTLNIDYTNHHNALTCPYCNPHGLKLAAGSPLSEETFLHEALASAVKDREYVIAHAKRLEALVPDHVCSECGHLFAVSDLIAESPEAWGHPCHAKTTRPVSACESYRSPVAAGSPLSDVRTRAEQWARKAQAGVWTIQQLEDLLVAFVEKEILAAGSPLSEQEKP